MSEAAEARKTRKAEYMAEYAQRPEVRARRAERKRSAECKAYMAEYKRRPEAKARHAERQSKYQQTAKGKARQAAYKATRHGWEKMRNATLLRAYGITLDDFRRLVLNQGGKCANCRRPLPGWEYEDEKLFNAMMPVVDHCHRTGSGMREAVRGVVHAKCNFITGLQGDDVEIARLNYEYLLRNERPLMALDAFEGEEKGRAAQVEEKRI